MKLHWNGEAILARTLKAAIDGVNDTTDAAAQQAKSNHPWRDESGRLEERITSTPATTDALTVTGEWGVEPGAPYAIDLELGTSKMAPRPFLRPAADAVYPRLPARIRDHLP